MKFARGHQGRAARTRMGMVQIHPCLSSPLSLSRALRAVPLYKGCLGHRGVS